MRVLPTISLVESAARLRRGDVTPTGLVEQCLARIDSAEESIQAWVVIDRDGARRQAGELERVGCRQEQPLWGIPVGIKDIIDVAGMPTRCGTTWKFDPPSAQEDAIVVRRLREAGAIILGKTVTTEWACFDPAATRNPWNPDRTPGGSSSGSAAAVASGMCVAALGTQTGGSILRPASFCGICGLKPAHRPEMLHGIALFSPSLDHVGPMAKTVADLQVLWHVLSPENASSAPNEWISMDLVDDPFLATAADDVRSEFARNIGSTDRFSPPIPFEQIHFLHRTIMCYEAAGVHRERFTAEPETFGPAIRGIIEEGLQISAADYAAVRREHSRLCQDIRANFPPASVLAMPTTMTAAPGRETTGDPRFNSPWSFFGLPALTLPCGVSHDGLPLGLQLIAPDETTLLAAGLRIEKNLAAADSDSSP